MRPWRSLLAASLVLVLASVIIALKAPVLIGCVFMHKANITCTWEPGDSQITTYTLNVWRMTWTERLSGKDTSTVPESLWLCPTTNTSCTLESPPKGTPTVTELLRVTYNFCVSVTAHSHHDNVTSEPRCQPGINEVLLPSVKLDSLTSVAAKPKCLKLTWTPNHGFPIFNSQIYDGNLKSQIEFRIHGQLHTRVSNVKVMDYSFMACVFSPDTLYSVRLRHRYQSRTSPWSQWSNERQGKTAEDAPSAAPMFWRKVLHQDEHRLTSLLWKPLPHVLANGRVLSYNVICQEENAKVLQDKGNCSNLDISHTSCVMKLPLGQCSCSISASTSVGTSPRAWIWLSKANEKEGPPLNHLSVAAVSDRSLGLKWSCSTASASSLSGFVVEWFVVTQEKNTQLYWERVNSSTTTVIISDGVEQFKRYAVSVRALYRKEGAGESKTEFVYTRQDVPSAGPQLQMQTSGSTVNLSWSLPVEQQRGFIRNYSLFYKTTNQPVERVVLPGSAEHYSLSLSPGLYKFWMQASTEAGEGRNGTIFSENIGPGEVSVVLYVLPIGLISVALIVIICMVQSEIFKGKFCQEIPDPSKSSMANWSPTTMMGMKFTQPDIQYSEVVPLNDRETENYGLDQDKDLQTCSYPSTLTDYKPFKCDIKYQTGARTSNMADTNITSCPVIYPTELSSSSLALQHLSYPNLKLYRQPQEGDSELCRFNAQVTDDPYIAFPSSCVASQLHSFNVKSFLSTPLLESDTFCQTEPQQNTSVPRLPFQESFLMDLISLSQSSAQCDPYLPA